MPSHTCIQMFCLDTSDQGRLSEPAKKVSKLEQMGVSLLAGLSVTKAFLPQISGRTPTGYWNTATPTPATLSWTPTCHDGHPSPTSPYSYIHHHCHKMPWFRQSRPCRLQNIWWTRGKDHFGAGKKLRPLFTFLSFPFKFTLVPQNCQSSQRLHLEI